VDSKHFEWAGKKYQRTFLGGGENELSISWGEEIEGGKCAERVGGN